MPVLEDLRHQLVAFDEHAALVVRGEVERTQHPVAVPRAQPRLGGVEQRLRDRRIALGLVEPEQAPAVVLELVQPIVDVSGDPSDGNAVAVGDEVLSFGVLEERVLALVEMPLASACWSTTR